MTAECKWMQDEICVNADCPMRADYCPVADNPGVCRYEEREDVTTMAERCVCCGDIIPEGRQVCSSCEKEVATMPITEAAPQWIPVTERLPEDDELVVAIVNGDPHKNIRLIGAYQMATYYRDVGWVVDLYPYWENADVTHWMPLPEPPKADK